MPLYDDYENPPRAADIPLTPENEALRVEVLHGIEAAITSEVAHTFEETDTTERTGIFALPHLTYLVRAAIFKVDGVPSSPDDETPAEPLMQVAVQATVHQLDKEKATDITPEEAAQLGFVWPDSLSLSLIDYTSGNLHNWNFLWQPGLFPPSFDFGGSTRGFYKDRAAQAVNPVLEAAGIALPENALDGPAVNQEGLDRVAEFRAINEVLNHGSADIAATQRLTGILAARETTELLTVDPQVMRNSMPHFRNLIGQALASPSFRDMLAWQQYWDQRIASEGK